MNNEEINVAVAPVQQMSQKEIIAKVVAKSKKAQKATATPKAAPPAAPEVEAAPVAAPAPSAAAKEEKASQDKVKEMAQKLGIPFTADLIALGTNAAISDALIEKAVAAGKSEAQINDAMSAL